mmetsp:Transcript_18323/g.55033  ORF Transcript_18323/g.55033 Transcript_18323/m.55033 type:complete len:374 (+) Transcript_18323:40-1161(+)
MGVQSFLWNGLTWTILVVAIVYGTLWIDASFEDDCADLFFTDDPQLMEWESKGEYVKVFNRYNIFVVDSLKSANSASRVSVDRTLLVVHGFPTSSVDFAPSLTRLHERFDRVILVDLPGFGLSDKPACLAYSLQEYADVLLAVWAQRNVTGGHLMLHDMGDSVGEELLVRADRGQLPAFLQPTESTHAAQVFPSVTFNNGGMHIELASLRVSQYLLRVPVFSRLFSHLFNEFVFRRQIRSILGSPDALSEADLTTMWQAILHKNGWRRIPQTIKYIDDRYRFQNARLIPTRTALSMPVHVLWGRLDTVAPLAIASAVMADLPSDSSTLTLLDAGHFAMLENPMNWADAVLNFYQSCHKPSSGWCSVIDQAPVE